MKAVVTGGNGGIGREIVKKLGRIMKVAVFDLPDVDVRSYESLAIEFGKIGVFQVLVNCAGVGLVKPFADSTLDEWRKQVDTNLYGVMNCCHAAIPYMRDGDIVNISSRSAKYDHKGLAAYCASKAGVSMFSDCIGQEFQKYGVRVSHILPGRVNTGFAGDPLTDWHIKPENVAEAVMNIISMDRNMSYGRVEVTPARSA